MKPIIPLRHRTLNLKADRCLHGLLEADLEVEFAELLSIDHFHWYEPMSKGIEHYPTPNHFVLGLKPLHYHYPDQDVPNHPHNQRDQKVHKRININARQEVWGGLSSIVSFMPLHFELADTVDPL